MCRLTQHEQARVLPEENEALGHFHVPFQPRNAVILSPVDLRGADTRLILPGGMLVVCTLQNSLVEGDA